MAVDIKRLYQTKEIAKFLYYRDGDLWYETTCGFKFPVPLSDAGSASFNAEEQASLLVRYIRRWEEQISGGVA